MPESVVEKAWKQWQFGEGISDAQLATLYEYFLTVDRLAIQYPLYRVISFHAAQYSQILWSAALSRNSTTLMETLDQIRNKVRSNNGGVS